MESILRNELNLSWIRRLEAASGGCCSSAFGYDSDKGKLFVKSSKDGRAEAMFKGELASLRAIAATHTVTVPQPLKTKEWILAMEYLDISPLGTSEKNLGVQLARLHLHNGSLRTSCPEMYVDKFGFECDTSCGLIPMPNPWTASWIDFYTNCRLQVQVDLLNKEHKDRELQDLWSQLKLKMPTYFKDVSIESALVHGDLWNGNVGQVADSPVIFDPGSFYGHHEFDLAITKMFGGFSSQFYDAYHDLIPQAVGFSARQKLYILFHYLNHWNHFGSGYRSKSLSLMKELISL